MRYAVEREPGDSCQWPYRDTAVYAVCDAESPRPDVRILCLAGYDAARRIADALNYQNDAFRGAGSLGKVLA